MENFDPAMHYGPNDAGVSAFTIAIAIVGVILGSWMVGSLYTLISGYLQKVLKIYLLIEFQIMDLVVIHLTIEN